MSQTFDPDVDTLDESEPEIKLKPVRCEFISGQAGTGKTFELQRRIAKDPSYGILTATTGIAAVNLGAVTINSALGYYDTGSLVDNAYKGQLAAVLRRLSQKYQNVVIDEISMMPSEQLDIIHDKIAEVNTSKSGGDLGLVVCGDFCQLPPVNARYAFEADCWPRFDLNTKRLTKVWRQEDEGFVSALRLAREGRGREAVQALKDCGVQFGRNLAAKFEGVTIIPQNDGVEFYNNTGLHLLPGKLIHLDNRRSGWELREWMWNPIRKTGIPDQLLLKEGAMVMILANDSPRFSYCNGDIGWVEDVAFDVVTVRLKRGGTVCIGRITRYNLQDDKPAHVPGYTVVHDEDQDKYVVGEIEYFPLRLAYASTVHKSQGLTVDSAQIDIRKKFFGEPNMAYVALSRVRSAGGLRIVGTPELLEKRINVDERVVRWL